VVEPVNNGISFLKKIYLKTQDITQVHGRVYNAATKFLRCQGALYWKTVLHLSHTNIYFIVVFKKQYLMST